MTTTVTTMVALKNLKLPLRLKELAMGRHCSFKKSSIISLRAYPPELGVFETSWTS